MADLGAETVEGTTIDGLSLPSQYGERVLDSSMTLDRTLGTAGHDDEQIGAAVRDHNGVLLHGLRDLPSRWRVFDLAWPSGWYIPGAADFRNFWTFAPPAENRYSHQWTSHAFNGASSATGALSAFQRLLPNDRFVSSEAGLGFLYTPSFTYGVVSLRPDVNCTGQLRWWQQLDEPIAGHTHTTTDLVLAMWHQIPGGWDLVSYRSVLVGDGFVQSGSGHSAVTPYARSFPGDDLATNFVVQKGHTYLFGVVARVNIWSTLTNSGGGPITMPDTLQDFRIWGTIVCDVPIIEVRQGVVYIA